MLGPAGGGEGTASSNKSGDELRLELVGFFARGGLVRRFLGAGGDVEGGPATRFFPLGSRSKAGLTSESAGPSAVVYVGGSAVCFFEARGGSLS